MYKRQPCEVCKGKRYNRETLEVRYKGKNIYEVLEMTVEEALPFFENLPRLYNKLQTLYEVGLSYVKLGQPSTTPVSYTHLLHKRQTAAFLAAVRRGGYHPPAAGRSAFLHWPCGR